MAKGKPAARGCLHCNLQNRITRHRKSVLNEHSNVIVCTVHPYREKGAVNLTYLQKFMPTTYRSKVDKYITYFF